ncbi:hypothetical protein [Nocardia altamirensis]|uniref:hypothetical protein n=1 Tax=Nocardia altamirensis TaxID=472158 RepID=UPI0008401202|nr:hypothetical protein [Nocardia altamirensis]
MQAVALTSNASTFAVTTDTPVIAGHSPAAAPTTTRIAADTHTTAIHHLTATASHEVGFPPNTAPTLTCAAPHTHTTAIHHLATISAVSTHTATPSRTTAALFAYGANPFAITIATTAITSVPPAAAPTTTRAAVGTCVAVETRTSVIYCRPATALREVGT